MFLTFSHISNCLVVNRKKNRFTGNGSRLSKKFGAKKIKKNIFLPTWYYDFGSYLEPFGRARRMHSARASPPPVPAPTSESHDFAQYILSKEQAQYACPIFLRRCVAVRSASSSYDACIYRYHVENYRADTFNPRFGIRGVNLYVKRFWIILVGWKLMKIAHLEGFQRAESTKT